MLNKIWKIGIGKHYSCPKHKFQMVSHSHIFKSIKFSNLLPDRMHSCLLEMVPHYPRPIANKNGIAERNGNLQRCSIVLMWPLKPLIVRCF